MATKELPDQLLQLAQIACNRLLFNAESMSPYQSTVLQTLRLRGLRTYGVFHTPYPADVDIGARDPQASIAHSAPRVADVVFEVIRRNLEHLLFVAIRQIERRPEYSYIFNVTLVDKAHFAGLARWSPLYNTPSLWTLPQGHL
jgi:hypothetical protein